MPTKELEPREQREARIGPPLRPLVARWVIGSPPCKRPVASGLTAALPACAPKGQARVATRVINRGKSWLPFGRSTVSMANGLRLGNGSATLPSAGGLIVEAGGDGAGRGLVSCARLTVRLRERSLLPNAPSPRSGLTPPGQKEDLVVDRQQKRTVKIPALATTSSDPGPPRGGSDPSNGVPKSPKAAATTQQPRPSAPSP